MAQRSILVAPLNWGLGHATRCIPIIKALLESGFTPILASDGSALELLKKEFPYLQSEVLPSYNIEYSEHGTSLKRKLISSLPTIAKAIFSERKITEHLVKKHDLKGIISDNRLGVRNSKIPSVIITHQLTVLSGRTSLFSSALHQLYINKFDECWVPDVLGKWSLSGKMGKKNHTTASIKYVGVLSRFELAKVPICYDILILLSGPEPQRSILENLLLQEFLKSTERILFVRGVIEEKQTSEINGNMHIFNFMCERELEQTINASKVVVARSGYSTIMDLAKLKKQAFFIPTPGQYEQEYLAKRLKKLGIADFCNQEDFNFERFKNRADLKGFLNYKTSTRLLQGFSLFECE